MKLWSFLILVSLVSCSEKAPPRVSHEVMKVSTQGRSEGNTRADASESNDDGTDTSQETSSNASINNQSPEALKANEQTLEKLRYLLSPESLSNLNIRNHPPTAKKLDQLLLSVQYLMIAKKSEEPAKELLAALRYECSDIVATCSGLNFLSQSAQISQTLQTLWNYTSVKPEILSYAYAFKVFTPETSLHILILKTPIEEWQAWIKTHPQISTDWIQVAVSQLVDSKKTSQLGLTTEEFKNWLKFSQTLSDQLFNSIIQIWSLADPSHFSAEFLKEVKANLSLLSKISVFTQQQKLVQLKVNFESLKTSLLRMDDPTDLIVAGVGFGLWSSDTAIQWLTSGNTNQSVIEKAVINFYKINLLIAQSDANAKAKAILNESVETEKLFGHFLEKSQVIRSDLARVKNQLMLVNNWALRLFAQRQWDGKNIRSSFDSLDQSIKLLISYPHVMVLFDRLSSKRFVIKIAGRTISSSDLMGYLFFGQLGLLTQYTESRTSLGAGDILQAFQMAVHTRLFEQFGMQSDQFAAKVSSLMSSRAVEFIHNSMLQLNSRLPYSPLYRQISSLCKGQSSTPFSFYLSELRTSPLLGDQMSQLFTSLTNRSEEAGGKKAAGLFYADKDYAEMLESARVDLTHARRISDDLLHSLEVSKTSFAQTLAVSKILEKTQRDVLQYALKLNENLGECFWKLSLEEKNLQSRLVSLEMQHLRQVHKSILHKRNGKGPAIKITDMEYSQLPVNYTTHERIETDSYVMNSVDIYLRFAQRLTRMNANVPHTLGVPKVSIQFGRQIDINSSVMSQSTEYVIPFDEDQEQFVSNGLRAMFTASQSGPATFDWYEHADERFQYWITDLKAKTSLYRFTHLMADHPMPAEKIIEQHVQILNHLKMSAFDRDLYGRLKQASIYSPLFLQDRILRYDVTSGKVTAYLGYFDILSEISRSADLGYGWDTAHQTIQDGERVANRPNFLEITVAYFQKRAPAYRASSLFGYDQVLDSQMDTQFKKLAIAEITQVRNLNAAIAATISRDQTRPESQRLRVDINLNKSLIGTYLSLGALNTYESEVRQFEAQTSGCFTQKKCSEF